MTTSLCFTAEIGTLKSTILKLKKIKSKNKMEKISSSLYTSYFVDLTFEPGKHFKQLWNKRNLKRIFKKIKAK